MSQNQPKNFPIAPQPPVGPMPMPGGPNHRPNHVPTDYPPGSTPPYVPPYPKR